MKISVMCAFLLFLCSGCNEVSKKTSITVNGTVHLQGGCGAMPSVETSGQSVCDIPFATSLSVFTLPDKNLVLELSTDADGLFSMSLQRGEYEIVTPKKAVIEESRTKLTVTEPMQLPVRILVSSGIR